jgi:hypothetical protein
MTWQAIYAWSRLNKAHAESYFRGQNRQATLDTFSRSKPGQNPQSLQLAATNFPSCWRRIEEQSGQTAQDRRHGLQAGPISRDDKLKNGLAFHLAYERQLSTNDSFSYLLRPSLQRVEGLLVRGFHVG